MDSSSNSISIGSASAATEDEVWSHIYSQLSDFHEVLFFTRPENLKEAMGKKNPKGKYASTALRVEEPESNSRTVHAGIIPLTSQEDVEFINLVQPFAQELFSRVKEIVEKRQITPELLMLWGQLSYYGGRIESYWTLTPVSISHRRGGLVPRIPLIFRPNWYGILRW